MGSGFPNFVSEENMKSPLPAQTRELTNNQNQLRPGKTPIQMQKEDRVKM